MGLHSIFLRIAITTLPFPVSLYGMLCFTMNMIDFDLFPLNRAYHSSYSYGNRNREIEMGTTSTNKHFKFLVEFASGREVEWVK